jgi:hypothetical protein
MNMPVWVEQQDGKFTASVLGSSRLRATGETREDAIRALSQLIQVCQRRGALVVVNMPEVPVADVPRRQWSEEEAEATREMLEEIYRYRDELKAREFPE